MKDKTGEPMRFSFIPFLLLVIPVLEIAVFILIGGEIGVLATLGLILLTAILGSILLRVQGFATLARIRAHVDAGKLPGRDLGDGAMILAAGILLLTPGFVTDALGFALFVPAVRRAIWDFIATRAIVVTSGPAGDDRRYRGPAGENVVELEPDEFSERSEPGSPRHDSPWKDEPPQGRS